MAEITPAMLDRAALNVAEDVPNINQDYDFPEMVCAFFNAMLANGKAAIEDREDWENSLQSIKRSTFLVIKLR